MRETMRLAFRLFLFALIASMALAATNEITKGPIAEQAKNTANAAREDVLPGADEYEEMAIEHAEQYPDIDQVCQVVRGGEVTGYTLQVTVRGYKGPIVMTVAVNRSGSVNALTINSQGETAGLGSEVAGQAFLSQFPGVAASPDTISSDVDAITGATVSSRAVLSGMEQALRYARDVLGVQSHAGEVITKADADAYHELAQQTGTEDVQPLSPYVALGYPNIRNVYTAKYEGQDAYVIEMTDRFVVLSKTDGAQLSPEAKADEAAAYFDAHLKGGQGQ